MPITKLKTALNVVQTTAKAAPKYEVSVLLGMTVASEDAGWDAITQLQELARALATAQNTDPCEAQKKPKARKAVTVDTDEPTPEEVAQPELELVKTTWSRTWKSPRLVGVGFHLVYQSNSVLHVEMRVSPDGTDDSPMGDWAVWGTPYSAEILIPKEPPIECEDIATALKEVNPAVAAWAKVAVNEYQVVTKARDAERRLPPAPLDDGEHGGSPSTLRYIQENLGKLVEDTRFKEPMVDLVRRWVWDLCQYPNMYPLAGDATPAEVLDGIVQHVTRYFSQLVLATCDEGDQESPTVRRLASIEFTHEVHKKLCSTVATYLSVLAPIVAWARTTHPDEWASYEVARARLAGRSSVERSPPTVQPTDDAAVRYADTHRHDVDVDDMSPPYGEDT